VPRFRCHSCRRSVEALPRVTLSAYPNPGRGPKGAPRSREAREPDAALFPNDERHRFLRHSQAAPRRELVTPHLASQRRHALERAF
ncbi:MAG: hypothetical protein ACRD5D_10580, partial [Candidatus Polarisedimenticolia bacterium]